MTRRAKQARAEVDRHLDALDEVDELGDEHYHRTHERFEAASDQRRRILEWIERFARRTLVDGADPMELLSVGCGGGVMDRRIVDAISATRDIPMHITGVDPNERHIRAFRDAFQDSPHSAATFTGTFDTFETERRFDLVYFLHSLYYFDTIEPALRLAAERLKPGGALVVLQAPNDALNHLADRVWRKQFDQDAWYSNDVEEVFRSMDGRISTDRIDARVDVTPCFDTEDPVGVELLDFIVQAETRGFSADFRQSLRDSLRAICDADGDRLYAAHPVDVLIYRPA